LDLAPASHSGVLSALRTMTRIYPQLDPATTWSRALGTYFAAGMHNPAPTLGGRRYVYDTPERVTFFEGVIVDARERLGGHDAADLDRFWEDIPAVAEGQYVAVRVSNATVELMTDPVGMEQVYYLRLPEGWLVSNSVTLLLRIVGNRPLDT